MVTRSTPPSSRWVAKQWRSVSSYYSQTLSPENPLPTSPFYGTEVEVVRALRRFDEQSFVVKLPEGLQIAVPAWMLDPVFCGQLPQRDHPLIALEALLELARFIETQRLPSSVTHSESGPSPRRGGIDAPRTKRDYRQQRLAFAKKGLWEKLPEAHRVRCRELIVELLRAVF